MLDLLKIDLDDHDAARDAPDLVRRLPEFTLWRASDASLVYAYAAQEGAAAPVEAIGGMRRVQLACEAVLAGASAGHAAPCHYVVETDVEPRAARDLEDWYRLEHLPGLARVPGTVRARRFIDPQGSPRYYACYDLVSHDVLTSAPWLAVRATDWSSRVRPMFRNTRRTLFHRLS